jgi:hypothetical protein
MEIKNDCVNPAVGLLRHVRRSLSWIHPADLDGVGFIWLVDDLPQEFYEHSERLRWLKEEEAGIRGLYVARRGKQSAYIILCIPEIYNELPLLYRLTSVATLRVSYSLAHEVAHHLIATRGYVFQPGEKYPRNEFEEEFCNRYASETLKKMQSRWRYKVGRWAMNELARWQYIFGCVDWEQKRYKDAAAHWYKTIGLNPDYEKVVQWYFRAKELSKREQRQN